MIVELLEEAYPHTTLIKPSDERLSVNRQSALGDWFVGAEFCLLFVPLRFLFIHTLTRKILFSGKQCAKHIEQTYSYSTTGLKTATDIQLVMARPTIIDMNFTCAKCRYNIWFEPGARRMMDQFFLRRVYSLNISGKYSRWPRLIARLYMYTHRRLSLPTFGPVSVYSRLCLCICRFIRFNRIIMAWIWYMRALDMLGPKWMIKRVYAIAEASRIRCLNWPQME